MHWHGATTALGAALCLLAALASAGRTAHAAASPHFGIPGAATSDAGRQEPSAQGELDSLLRQLASNVEGPAALRPAYDAFLKSMEEYNADAALRIARAMHQRSFAMLDSGQVASTVWSVFCLEGALRRGATAANEDARFREASSVIRTLQHHPRTSSADRLALIQRHAIVAAAFGRHGIEAADLGGALAQGGIDGAQITGLARLGSAVRNGMADSETAAALFANLLDRTVQGPGGPMPVGPNDAPWALRGHGLAVLEALRSRSR